VHALIEIGKNGLLTAADLCQLLGLEKSSISRLLRKLLDAGELAEGASAEDGRAKPLSLTPKGQQTLAAIDSFAEAQVRDALGHLPSKSHGPLRDALALYADALKASRMAGPSPVLPILPAPVASPAVSILPAAPDLPAPPVLSAPAAISIAEGYQPGIIGRTAEMHARYYARTVGFGHFFESQVASGLAEFSGRLKNPVNQLWAAMEGGNIVGSIAIDGEDLGEHTGHLRWFIVEDGRRGGGVGRQLLGQAVAFCDQQGFAETHLWTFRGLDAARKLYEAHGFVLAQEQPGQQWGEEVVEQRFVRQAGQDAQSSRQNAAAE
jgi:DNA-binding MarR family transcriptional regulator/GNAT superfamily N-acetyltransferase